MVEVGICYGDPVGLIDDVEGLQHILPDQLTIPHNIQRDGILRAVCVTGFQNILNDSFFLLVFDEDIFSLPDWIGLEVVIDELITLLGLAEDDCLVVGVVLCKDGVEGELE